MSLSNPPNQSPSMPQSDIRALEKIIDDVYSMGLNQAKYSYDDYTTLKPGVLKKLERLITNHTNAAVISELSNVQLEHGRYVTQTFIDGQAMTIQERIADLESIKEKYKET